MSSTFTARELLKPNGELTFLGTMAGDQIPRSSGHLTYGRKYKTMGSSDEFRKKIDGLFKSSSTDRFKKLKDLGDNYSFTPSHLRDSREFGRLPTSCQGGGFFLNRKLGDSDKHLSILDAFSYIIRVFTSKFQEISGLPIQELEKRSRAYGSHFMLHHFFEPVQMPKEGDLVVYSATENSSPLHYGIFRESLPNWNSPCGGTVESKLYLSPYVFQHDFFFVPSSFGNCAKFYRIKNESVYVDLPIKSHDEGDAAPDITTNNEYTLQDDGSIQFNTTKENLKRRAIVDEFYGKDLERQLPDLERQSHIQYTGKCYHYAFDKILSNSISMLMDTPYLAGDGMGKNILLKYFTITTAPQKGDLVAYYKENSITHWGIYLGDGRIESKWGNAPVYRHAPFDAPSQYGDIIKIFRLNDGLTLEMLSENLKKDDLKMRDNS